MPRPRYDRPPSDVSYIQPDWPGLLESVLTVEGSTLGIYNRLHRYSMGNRALLMYQGVTPQPVATYQGWQAVNRQVKRGAKARAIIRPITVKIHDKLDENGNPRVVQRFKLVNAIFPICDTEGEPLPDIETPVWSRERAIGALGVRQVEFASFDSNTQGYSIGNTFAINPTAPYSELTTLHELAHIVHGHTTPQGLEEYQLHRGVMEFEAEGSAFLALNELELITPETASISRGYCQGWMKGHLPTDGTVRAIFKTTDRIVTAGLEPDDDEPASMAA
jgi:hypothetical protein